MSKLSLISIMREDPGFGQRIQKKAEEIKMNQDNLRNFADEYGKKYEDEIIHGTELRAKLLTEGSQKGLSEEEIMSSYGRFVPTVYTPVLNMLYFMMRETEKEDATLYAERDIINEKLIKTGQLWHTDKEEEDVNEDEIEKLLIETLKSVRGKTKNKLRVDLNKKLEEHKKPDDAIKNTPEMVNFLYGNITLDIFNKIKKLKALSQSPNEQEAFQAYRKAMELCKEYKL